MSRFLKRLIQILIFLLVLLVIAATALVFFVNPDRLKQ